MALDRRDGEVQRRRDLGVALAPADGHGDVALARAERRQPRAGVLGPGAGVGVAGDPWPAPQEVLSPTQWAQAGTALALWMLLPLLIGTWRITRREVAA